ncbi:MAG: MFS transporter [Deltaproteobacteria bacterium]|nr:MFS transporter [Deltaproteobacteria bacterium]
MSLAERRWLRLFTLCSLYVAQGIPWGFMATTLPAYLKSRGVSDAALASALAMTTLPYTFKWVWGPVMDAFTIPSLGRRRPWIVFSQLMMAVTVIVMVAIPDVTVDLELLAVMILIHTVFNSMQDVATDALAVDLLDEDERGRANGMMYACKYGGAVIGGAGMGRVVAEHGLVSALVVQTVILLAIMMVPLFVRERSGPPTPRPPLREIFDGLAQAATIRSTFVVALLVLGLNVALGVLYIAAVGLYVGELEWTQTEYTDLVGGLGLFAGFGGSLLGGFLADIVGRRRLIAIASIGMAIGWLIFAAARPLWEYEAVIYALAIWETTCTSVMIVSVFALCMEVSWPRVAATQFTSYMALSNLSTTIGYKLGGEALSVFSYTELYFVAGAFQILITSLVIFIDPTEVRRKLPLAPGWKLGPFGILTGVVFLVAVGVVPVLLLLLR